MAAFQYSPLDADESKKEFRLLDLEAEEQDGEQSLIRCHLRHESLERGPIYKALSYVWGDPTPVCLVLLNGSPHHIPRNLYDAPRELLKQGQKSVWADAICINQNDSAEKTTQLKLMRLIYTKSEQTLIWLGPEANDSNLAVETLREAGKLEETMDPPEQRFKDALYSLQTIAAEPEEEKTRAVNALIAFLDRHYWRRTWIIQEVCLAVHTIVICGSKNITWLELANGAFRMPGYGRDYQVDELNFDGTYGITRIAGIRAAYHHVEGQTSDNTAGGLNDWARENLRHRQESEPGFTETGAPSLISALMACNYAQASEPHDKLYGLLGLANDSEKLIPNPVYTVSVSRLYADFTRAVIRETGSLNVICLGKKGNSGFSDLPSWALDASRPFGLGLAIRNWILRTYKASGDRTPGLSDLRRSTDPDTLTVEGIVLDEVDGLGAAVEHGKGVIGSTIQSKLSENAYCQPEKVVIAMLKTSVMSWGSYGIAPEWFFSAAPQVIFKAAQRDEMDPSYEPELSQWCNATRDLKFAGKSIGQWMEEWPSYLGYNLEDHNRQYPKVPLAPNPRRGLQNLNRSSSGVAIELHKAALQKRLLVTRAGRIGLAAPQARPGDKIVILFGCDVPVILRQRDNESAYELVGEAFVYNYMKGEAMEALEEDQVRNFDLR